MKCLALKGLCIDLGPSISHLPGQLKKLEVYGYEACISAHTRGFILFIHKRGNKMPGKEVCC